MVSIRFGPVYRCSMPCPCSCLLLEFVLLVGTLAAHLFWASHQAAGIQRYQEAGAEAEAEARVNLFCSRRRFRNALPAFLSACWVHSCVTKSADGGLGSPM